MFVCFNEVRDGQCFILHTTLYCKVDKTYAKLMGTGRTKSVNPFEIVWVAN